MNPGHPFSNRVAWLATGQEVVGTLESECR